MAASVLISKLKLFSKGLVCFKRRFGVLLGSPDIISFSFLLTFKLGIDAFPLSANFNAIQQLSIHRIHLPHLPQAFFINAFIHLTFLLSHLSEDKHLVYTTTPCPITTLFFAIHLISYPYILYQNSSKHLPHDTRKTNTPLVLQVPHSLFPL